MNGTHTTTNDMEIVVRIPGLWKSPGELIERLPEYYEIHGDQFVTPQGACLFIGPMPPDGEFPGIFRSVCRRPQRAAELADLERYTVNVAVAGPGGSTVAAKNLLEGAAGIVRAGGLGVFIDNSAMALAASDWLELYNHRDEAVAYFHAFVSMTKLGANLVSHGMHTLGQRDAIIAHDGRPDTALRSLEDFLRTCCTQQPEWTEGAAYCDRGGKLFQLTADPFRSTPEKHPMHNPWGCWRLQPCPAASRA